MWFSDPPDATVDDDADGRINTGLTLNEARRACFRSVRAKTHGILAHGSRAISPSADQISITRSVLRL
jgi:hypothetical protein